VTGRLIGVGVGPGDPELVTVKGVRVFREADVVFVPVLEGDQPGRAEAVVLAHADPARIRRLRFTLGGGAAGRAANWRRAAAEVAAVLARGRTAAFATLGDPAVYSTFAYLTAAVRAHVPDATVETVPGVTAMQDLAARSGVSLVEGAERLALLPLAAGAGPLGEALAAFDTVVCYKGGRHLPELLEVLRDTGRLERAVYGAHLGTPAETIRPAAELDPRAGAYLSTLIALPERREAGAGP
jgi:precorrin-2/cobalt-factor-2 C20-methyltransferase